MRRQRPNNLQLNLKHSLCIGLVAAFPGLLPFVNLVTGKAYTSPGFFESDEMFTSHWRTDGVSGRFIEIDRFGLISHTDRFTMSVWIKATQSTSGTHDRYIGPIGTTNNFGACIQVDPSNKIGVAANKQGVADVTASSSSALTIGQWYHVTGVFDGASVALYIDGLFVTSANYDANITSSTNGGTGWVFGGEKFNGSMANTTAGSIANALIYNRVLSAAEIWQLWADPWAMYRVSSSRKFNTFPFTISLDELILSSSIQDLTVVPGTATLSLDSLLLTSSPQVLQVNSIVSVLMDTLTLASDIQDLTLLSIVSVLMDSLTLQSNIQSLSIVPGAAFVSLATLTLISSPEDILILASALLDTLTLASSLQNLTVIPGTVSVLMDSLMLNSSIENIELFVGAFVTLTSLILNSSPQNLTIVPGVTSILLDSLSLASDIQDLTVITFVSVLLNSITLISSVEDLTVSPGVISVLIDTLQLVSSVEDLSLASINTVVMDTLVLTGLIQTLSLTTGETSVLLDSLSLSSSVLDLEALGGNVILSLDTLTLASSVNDIVVRLQLAILQAVFKGMFKGMNK